MQVTAINRKAGGMSGPFADDPSGDPAPHAENRRLRILTERSRFHGDELASLELKEMIKPYVRQLVRHIDRRHLEDATQRLTIKAFRVLKERLDEVDNLVGYLRRSLRNELLDFLQEQRTIADWEIPIREGQDFHSAAATDLMEHRLQDQVMQKYLDAWKAEALKSGDHTSFEVAQVIELCYFENLRVSEACAALNFSSMETKTISQKIARQRKDPNSKLADLARRVIDGTDDQFP
jgi:DNA-directed RNA polymerase specialized sigma24 family protein